LPKTSSYPEGEKQDFGSTEKFKKRERSGKGKKCLASRAGDPTRHSKSEKESVLGSKGPQESKVPAREASVKPVSLLRQNQWSCSAGRSTSQGERFFKRLRWHKIGRGISDRRCKWVERGRGESQLCGDGTFLEVSPSFPATRREWDQRRKKEGRKSILSENVGLLISEEFQLQSRLPAHKTEKSGVASGKKN